MAARLLSGGRHPRGCCGCGLGDRPAVAPGALTSSLPAQPGPSRTSHAPRGGSFPSFCLAGLSTWGPASQHAPSASPASDSAVKHHGPLLQEASPEAGTTLSIHGDRAAAERGSTTPHLTDRGEAQRGGHLPGSGGGLGKREGLGEQTPVRARARVIPVQGPVPTVLSPDGAGRVTRPSQRPQPPEHPRSSSGSSMLTSQVRKQRPGSQGGWSEASPRGSERVAEPGWSPGLPGPSQRPSCGSYGRPACGRTWALPGPSWAFLGSRRAVQQSRNPPSGALGAGAFVLYLRTGACEPISRVTRGNVCLPEVAAGAIWSPVLRKH